MKKFLKIAEITEITTAVNESFAGTDQNISVFL